MTDNDTYDDPCLPYIDKTGWFDVDKMENDYRGKTCALDVMRAIEHWNPSLCYTMMEGIADGYAIGQAFDLLRDHQERIRILDLLTGSIEHLHSIHQLSEADYERLMRDNTWANARNTKDELDRRVKALGGQGVMQPLLIEHGIAEQWKRAIDADKPAKPRKTQPSIFDGIPMTMFRNGTAYRIDQEGQTIWADRDGTPHWCWLHSMDVLIERETMKTVHVENQGGYKKTLQYLERQFRKTGLSTAVYGGQRLAA